MRASRLVALVLHLQAVGGTTAQALADQLEVSVRTIYRDVSALQEAGVPLWAEPGPGGGVRLLPGWSGRLDSLTADEADAMGLAATPAIAAELGLGTLVAAAQSKVLNAMPPELRGRASRVRDRFLLDAPGWFHRRDDLPHLPTVADAVWRDRRLDISYRRADKPVRRRIDPLGLVLKGGIWYLVAAHRGQPRSYRISRIHAATILAERGQRPPGFDLAAWWHDSSDEFDRSLLRSTLTIRVDEWGRRWLASAVGETAAALALEGALAPEPDGWQTLVLGVESEQIGLRQLTSLGSHVEIVAPTWAREALAEVGAAMAERNRKR